MPSGEKISSDQTTETGQWDSLIDYEAEPEEPLTPEQKKAVLTFENVSELSTEEYLELWRRLNPFYVTHITRQGIRDHSGMIEHSTGMRAFQDGMKAILRDGRTLRTKAGANYDLMPGFTEDDVAHALDIMISAKPERYSGLTPEEIIDKLPVNDPGLAAAEPWPDEQAVHFGQLTVLDDFYGSETGNETFCVFPADIIASQCRFGGHISHGLIAANQVVERKWNDFFVWPEDGKIPLDAGIVFLPKSRMVSRENGSRYSLQEHVTESGETRLMPEIDEERIERFKTWLENLTKDSPEVIAVEEESDFSLMQQKLSEIGIPNHLTGYIANRYYYNIIHFIETKKLDAVYIPDEEQANMTPDEIVDYCVRKFLASINADLKEAKDAIPAQEYWEQYFAEHPEEKPKHIIYYDGDPSDAVKELLAQHGIAKTIPLGYKEPLNDGKRQTITGPSDTSKRDGEYLGFDDHYVRDPEEDEKMSAEHKRFNELALKILRERQAAK